MTADEDQGTPPADLAAPDADGVAGDLAPDGAPPPASEIAFDIMLRYRTGSPYGNTPFVVGDFDRDGRSDVALTLPNDDAVALLRADGKGGLLPPALVLVPRPTRVAAGDLNGDGKLDLVVMSSDDRRTVLLGNGDGTFASLPPSATDSFQGPPLLGDFNSDGKLDLVLLAGGGRQGVMVLPGQGDGGFGPRQWVSLAFEARVAALLDANGDGKRDLAVLSLPAGSATRVALLPGQGNGTFHSPRYAPLTVGDLAPEHPFDLVVGDFDGDRREDLLVVDLAVAWMLTGTAEGGLNPRGRLAGGRRLGGGTAGDWNGDGKPDLALTGQDATFQVRLGRGDGTFAEPLLYHASERCGPIHPGDIDGDARLDLLCASITVGVARGRGDGTFRAAPVVLEAQATGAMVLGDLDRDGWLDLVLRSGERSLTVLRGQTGGRLVRVGEHDAGVALGLPALGDLDGDGNLDVVAGGTQVVVWRGDGTGGLGRPTLYPGSERVALGDLDGDRKLDVVSASLERVFLLLGDGRGGLQPRGEVVVGSNLQDLAVADLNHDGAGEILALDGSARLVVVPVGPGGMPGMPVSYTTGAGAWAARVADWNGDGKLDVLVIRQDMGTDLLLGHGDGTLAAARPRPLDASFLHPRQVVMDDLDGDRRPDLFLIPAGGGQVDVFRGEGDGRFAPRLRLPALFPVDAVSGDLDRDGRPDVLVQAEPLRPTRMLYLLRNASR